MANSLIITKLLDDSFSFVVNGDSVNTITNLRNDMSTVGDEIHIKTSEGANLIKLQQILYNEVTIVDGSTLPVASSILDLRIKLRSIGFWDWLDHGGIGVDRFDNLDDTFAYFGNDGKIPMVDESQLKLIAFSLPDTSYLNLFPSPLQPLKGLRVNAAGDAYEFYDIVNIVTQEIRSGYTETAPSEDAVFQAIQSISISIPDATTSTKGIVKLAGDLGGTADLPTVPGLLLKQDTLISGTNIKTVEGQSLLGIGNIDLTKSDVGLSNVDNTSDLSKPISTATQTALDNKADLVAGKVPSSQLPSYVDDVLEGYLLSNVFYVESGHTTVIPAESGKIYIDLTTGQKNKEYRYSGSTYIQITNGLIASTDDVPEGSSLYFTTARVLATLLTGISFATGGAIVSTDSILIAFGKIQKQLNDISTIYQVILTDVNFGAFINGLTGKTTPVDADSISIVDSADSNKQKKVSLTNFKAYLKTYFDGLYTIPQITITTSTSITTATNDSSGNGQKGRNVIIDNSTNAISLTVNGGTDFVSSYVKHGTGTITFVQGSGRTLKASYGILIMDGGVGSTATISSVGTIDYLRISNI